VRRLWLLAFIGCAGSLVDTDTKPLPARTPEALRVMSYNVNFGMAGDPPTVDAIKLGDPDIVLLQETNAEWATAMLERLDYRYHSFEDPDGVAKRWPAGGMGILSRDPIVSIDRLPEPPGALFFALRIVIDTKKLGRVQFVDFHLRPPMSDGGSWLVGYWSTREVREREVQYHLAEIDPKLPTIICGDFNEEADGHAISLLADRGFTDAVHQFIGARTTWEWPTSSITLRLQLDHILYDDHFVALGANVLRAGRSDHFPVFADFIRMDP